MATQASAITFLSTPGQAFVDGMRFVQFYFGLPIAMVVLSITAVPLYRRLKVFTAYEYLEHRFDLKTRTLTCVPLSRCSAGSRRASRSTPRPSSSRCCSAGTSR